MTDQNRFDSKNNLFMEQNIRCDAINEADIESGDSWLIQRPSVFKWPFCSLTNANQSKKHSQESVTSIIHPKPHSKKNLFDEQSDFEAYSLGTLSTRSSVSLNQYKPKLLLESSLPLLESSLPLLESSLPLLESSLPLFESEESLDPNLHGSLERKNDNRKFSLSSYMVSLKAQKSLSQPMERIGFSETRKFSQDPSIGCDSMPTNFIAELEKLNKDIEFPPKVSFEFLRFTSKTPQPTSMDIENENFSPNSQYSNKSFFDSQDLQATPSFSHALPTIPNSKNPSMATISASMLEELLTTNINNHQFLIIDCRYAYEYNGGHIKDAINISDPMILERLLVGNKEFLHRAGYIKNLKQDFNTVVNSLSMLKDYENEPRLDSPPILIFHCEFSYERGPRMLSHIRQLDRDFNRDNYPHLDYPEVYLLADGYKNFHASSPKCCDPIGSYIEMKDERFKNNYLDAHHRDRVYWNKKTGNVRKNNFRVRAFSQIVE